MTKASMRKFIGQPVDVETGEESLDPKAVVYKDKRWEVAEIEQSWFDTGHGSTPVSARSWRTRRHRKNFVVRSTGGERLTLYLDYGRSDKKTWHLVTVEDGDS